VRVRGPSGAEWTVRVVWQPRWRSLWRRFRAWRKHRNSDLDVVDVPLGGDGAGGGAGLPGGRGRGGLPGGRGSGGLPGGRGRGGFLDSVGDDFWIVVAVVAVALFAVFAWWVLVPVLLLFLDAVVVAVLLVAAVPLRVLFRRPWTVAASLDGEQAPAGFAVQVVGWRAARAAPDEIADRIRAGLPPAPSGFRSLDAR
jgi:hypothetical protein